MIDTDKYEGHTEGKWDVTMDDTMEGYYFFRQGYDREQEEDCDYDECRANARLMSDAPNLLTEVKRLYELHALVGVPITWKVDYGDGGGYETFVADAVEWNYDDSGEWGLVNYNETRWMTLETAKEWMKND